MIARFQHASQSLRYAQVPTVAAVQGLALGGGCEFVMHAQHRVFALEAYVGLVEAGVGVIPAGGGCKYLAVRAHELAAGTPGGDVFPFLQNVFQNVAMANVSKSAHQAIQMGYGKASDDVVFNPHELLYVALRRARAAAEAGARPPLPAHDVVVAGRNGIAACEMMLINLREGGLISAYDYRVARAAAVALCGGEVESGARVDERWLLDVERTLFVDLLEQEQTQQRIAHMLDTGKPLRN
jgi:3-hydroxyacyl-CoA dehydrogenase